MHLALNTFVYEVANVPIQETLQRARKLGFTYLEYAAHKSGDPTQMTREQRAEVVRIAQDCGLHSAQLLMVGTGDIASPDPAKRRACLDYMKACAEFQLALGGRQVLICRGCGIHEPGMMREEAWVNTISSLREFSAWCLGNGVLIDLELDPHVYFVVNSTARMAKAIEDVGQPNVLANVDVGHLSIVREGPNALEKLKTRMIQVHLSETDTFEHTNGILGTGMADFKAFVDKALALGIEENCRKLGEPCVAGIEMGERGGRVDDPDRWVQESLDYLAKILPELGR